MEKLRSHSTQAKALLDKSIVNKFVSNPCFEMVGWIQKLLIFSLLETRLFVGANSWLMRKEMFFLPLLILLSCSSDKQSVVEDNRSVFRYNESAGISILDPAYVRRFEDFLIMGQLFNCLVALDDEMNVVPAIAESWEISEDGKIYTFNLRQDVYFHDHPRFESRQERLVNAHDILYSFLRVIDPITASPGKYIFQNIDRSENSGYKGMVVTDDFQIKIFLKEPQPSFIFQLSLPYCSVVPAEIVEYYGQSFGQNPIGTGPFVFKSWKPEVKLVLVKNNEYFERDADNHRLPYLDAIAVNFIQDKHQEFVKFKAGDLEMISGLNEDDKDELLDLDGMLKAELGHDFYLHKLPWLNTDYLGVLVDDRVDIVQESPLKDKLVRQAVGYAINRGELVKYLRNNVGKPAEQGFVPVGMPGFDNYNVDGFIYAPDKAKSLLAQAGFPGGKGAPEITLVATKEYKGMCEYLQHTLSQIGLTVKIDLHSTVSMNQHIALFESNFYRKSWIADYPDALNFLQLFYSKNFYPENGSNYTHFANAVYDQLYELARIEKNDIRRFEYYKRMLEILQEEAPVIPLFYAETLRFFNKNVSGVSGNYLNQLSLKRVKISEN